MLNRHGKHFTGIVIALMSSQAFADPECGSLRQANLGYVQPGEEGLPVAETLPVEAGQQVCNTVVETLPAPVTFPLEPVVDIKPQPVPVPTPAPVKVVEAPKPVVEEKSHITVISSRIEVEGAEASEPVTQYEPAYTPQPPVEQVVVYEEASSTSTSVDDSYSGTVVDSYEVYEGADSYTPTHSSQVVTVTDVPQGAVYQEERVIVEESVVEETVVEQPIVVESVTPVVTTVHRPAHNGQVVTSIRNYNCANTVATATYHRVPNSHGGCGNRELYEPRIVTEEVVEEELPVIEEHETPAKYARRCVDYWMALCRRMTAPGNRGSGL